MGSALDSDVNGDDYAIVQEYCTASCAPGVLVACVVSLGPAMCCPSSRRTSDRDALEDRLQVVEYT